MATIDAKLSALLKLAVEEQSRPATNGPAAPTDLAAHAASLEALLLANGAPPPAPPTTYQPLTGTAPTPNYQPLASPAPSAAAEADLAGALDEIARLLALSLKRKRDLADVVADLDSVGFDRARIGELLGISPSHVDAALVAYDRRDRKRRRQKRR